MKKRLKRGYDIELVGDVDREIETAPDPDRVAVKPAEFKGIKDKPAVREGDYVKAGDPVAYNKWDKKVKFTSPVSGKVEEIQIGYRRRIEAIVIKNDYKYSSKKFTIPALSSREKILNVLKESGLLPHFVERPFGKVPDGENLPRDIFISTLNTAPLTPDNKFIIKEYPEAFEKGLQIITNLTDGSVFMNSSPEDEKFYRKYKEVEHLHFQGQHPAGNVGVHIHHTKPIKSINDIVWTIGIQGLLDIGNLFLHGKLQSERLVKVAGESSLDRRYFRTIAGAQLNSFVQSRDSARVISGDVLTGVNTGLDGYLSLQDNLVTVIPEVEEPELLGWITPGLKKESRSRTFLSNLLPFVKPRVNTSYNGGKRAFILSGIYREVLPMDIYPEFLIKSILAEDFEDMLAYGILEVIEEDLAICEYVCPSKIEFQKILGEGLQSVEKELT